VAELVLPGRFRAAVFDFDGLLVDSEPGWARAEAQLLANHGSVFTPEDAAATVGRSPDQSIAIYGSRLGWHPARWPELKAELLALVGDEYRRGFPPMPGAVLLVTALAGRLPVALASNTGRDLIAPGLAATPFASVFPVVLTADDVANHKPAPDLYLLACERLGVAPADAVAFEDSLTGVRSARAAGLTVVAVPEQRTPAFDIADLVVGSLLEVTVE
jgi:HAD superfamily hydrolase (TIGR01509 family)